MTDVEVSIRIEAPPETVFAYFTDPDRMRTWMGTTAEIDPRPGGTYRVNVTGIDVAAGEYLEVVPPERIVWTWGWEGSDTIPPGTTTVEVTLTPDGDATVVQLRHTGLPTEEFEREHRQGWTHYWSRLAIAASGADPGPDPQLRTTT